jgi:hypothetical protein
MTPLVWIRLMQQSFGVTEPFARKLWKHLDASPTLLYQLSLLDVLDTHAVPREVAMSRLRRLGELLLPDMLIQTSVRVHPENGRARPSEALKFEEGVLACTDRRGGWKW